MEIKVTSNVNMTWEDFEKTIRISEYNYKRVKALAKQNEVSMAKQLNKMLDEMLDVLLKETK